MNPSNTFFYTAIGAELTVHEMNPHEARLSRGASISAPDSVQYVCPHPSLSVIYVVTSNGGPGGLQGDTHHASAYRLDPGSGALSAVGTPRALAARPIHCTVDHSGRYLLIAYNLPSALSVHALAGDGAVGEPIAQADDLDFGTFSHQVRVTPSNHTVIMPARGNDASDTAAEDPGALKVYDFVDGRLANRASVTPGTQGGYGFGPRHLDIHPNGRWVYLSVERQNQLQTYALEAGRALSDEPLFSCSSLRAPVHPDTRQIASAVWVHPNGRFVYQANRSDHLRVDDGWPVGREGEDTLVVYAIDAASGEPRVIQHVETDCVHVRTFSIDPGGKLLIAATIKPVAQRHSNGDIRLAPATLVLYHIGDDGRLSRARSYEIDTAGAMMFWTGMLTPPAGVTV